MQTLEIGHSWRLDQMSVPGFRAVRDRIEVLRAVGTGSYLYSGSTPQLCRSATCLIPF
jgi:hypothetical protein